MQRGMAPPWAQWLERNSESPGLRGPKPGKQLEGMTERMVSLFTEGLGVDDGCDAVLKPSG